MSSDGGSAAQYDEQTGGYYAYIRVGGMGRRATGLTRTDDFWRWPQASLVLAPDPQDDPDLILLRLLLLPLSRQPGSALRVRGDVSPSRRLQRRADRLQPRHDALVPAGPPLDHPVRGAR